MKLILAIHPIDSTYPHPDILREVASGPDRRPTETALMTMLTTLALPIRADESRTPAKRSREVDWRI